MLCDESWKSICIEVASRILIKASSGTEIFAGKVEIPCTSVLHLLPFHRLRVRTRAGHGRSNYHQRSCWMRSHATCSVAPCQAVACPDMHLRKDETPPTCLRAQRTRTLKLWLVSYCISRPWAADRQSRKKRRIAEGGSRDGDTMLDPDCCVTARVGKRSSLPSDHAVHASFGRTTRGIDTDDRRVARGRQARARSPQARKKIHYPPHFF